ncbi:MAG TPA: redoxin domain-containing protein, partial [Verrucomicrobia bacterium]|nr:redoxin domain-containing protein [Verrucomicrobiota bacterium]
MQLNLKSLKDQGIQVAAVSFDSVEILKRYAKKGKITFPLLSDQKSTVIAAYGILNKQANGVPYPGTFLIDRKGVIQGKLFHDGYKKRHASEEIITGMEKI